MSEPEALGSHPQVAGFGVEKSTVLRLFAAGLSPEAIAQRVSDRFDQRLTTEDVRTVLRETEVLMQGGASLLPPAEAAFVDQFPAVLAFATLTRPKPQGGSVDASAGFRGLRSSRPSADDLARLGRLSHRLIGRYLDDGGEVSDPGGAGQPEGSVALQYAEAVLRQAEVIARLNALVEEAPLQAALPAPDQNRIVEFLLYRNLRGHFETLDSLLAAWERLIDALTDHPESLLYEEYVDWLTKRDSLKDALVLLSPGSRSNLEARVRELDERFLQATKAIPTTIDPTSPWTPRPWWWYRIPQRLDKDFKTRLENLG